MPDIDNRTASCMSYCGIERSKCGNRYCSANPRYFKRRAKPRRAPVPTAEEGRILTRKEFYEDARSESK